MPKMPGPVLWHAPTTPWSKQPCCCSLTRISRLSMSLRVKQKHHWKRRLLGMQVHSFPVGVHRTEAGAHISSLYDTSLCSLHHRRSSQPPLASGLIRPFPPKISILPLQQNTICCIVGLKIPPELDKMSLCQDRAPPMFLAWTGVAVTLDQKAYTRGIPFSIGTPP